MTTLIIPELAAIMLIIATSFGASALLALGSEVLSREVSHWSNERDMRLRRALRISRILALVVGGLFLYLAVTITIVEAGL
ncbi:membrane protein [Microbacterium phage Grassboy]|nr:membrane protein [Microbacterium phage Grassboy]